METAKYGPSGLGPRSASPKSPASPANYTHRVPRGARLELFNSPYQFPSSHKSSSPRSPGPIYPGGNRSSGREANVQVSPTAMPLSFNALRESAHTLDMRIKSSSGTSPGQPSPSPLSPTLTFRRSPGNSSSLYKDVEELNIGERPKRNHHRRATARGESSRRLSGEHARDIQTEDTMFPTTVHDVRHCDENHCRNHHHRQSSSSTISIKCDRSDEDESNYIADRYEAGDIEASIHMEPMAPQMLVPLMDRPTEMLELLEHRSNRDWASLVRRTVGDKLYKAQCLPLWTETDRRSLPDREWLRRSKELLIRKSCGGCTDGRLWSEFCAMVGWDESEIEMEEEWARSYSYNSRRSTSRESGSPQMKAILEAEDEEESRRW